MLSGRQILAPAAASIIGRSSLLLLLTTTITLATIVVLPAKCSGGGGIVSDAAREFKLNEDALLEETIGGGGKPAKHPVFFSELRLRSIVEQANADLRQLKRAYVEDMTNIYLPMKLDPTLGFEVARLGESQIASAQMLVAAEFGDIVKKKYVIQRRLLTGIKLAFVKFLPMNTLVRLYKRYKSFAWLKDQTQVDLRPKFPTAKGKWIGCTFANLAFLCAALRGAALCAADKLLHL